jgi:hypothetical protein
MKAPKEHAGHVEGILFPRETLVGKNNFKRYFFIFPDGLIREHVFLNILEKRQREQVICLHFLQMLTRHVLRDMIGIKILSRDAPWDFQLELSTGTRFNLEIVSVADNDLLFKVLSREEGRDISTGDACISLRRLQKIARGFPNIELDRIIAGHIKEGRLPDDLVPNPDFGETARIYLSSGLPPERAFHEIIENAIKSKENKNNGQKENTILVIDNRSSIYFVDEVTNALDILEERIGKSPFKEVWFYNGYYSDWDGNNSEYTFIPFKISDEVARILKSEM